MLLSCSSCNSKYLLNSADLKPNGRDVKCAVCGHEWFQEADITIEDFKDSEILKESKSIENEKNIKENVNTNLPSTYVKEYNPKIINSVIVIIFLFLFIFILWFIKKEQSGLMALFHFYTQEFYFNLKLIFNDFIKLVKQIIR